MEHDPLDILNCVAVALKVCTFEIKKKREHTKQRQSGREIEGAKIEAQTHCKRNKNQDYFQQICYSANRSNAPIDNTMFNKMASFGLALLFLMLYSGKFN